ncbi:DUF2946 family protein [Halomonas sp. A020]|uniref:DUF2946 family protein n=1 Tax=Halomonas sp. A020 TaxID=2717374 RepID=UPI002493C2A3|nr:DUF2946 family protein [Halomonas sp. A020]
MGYRIALYLAFAALFLVFAGPLLSQFQAQGHATAHAHGQHATHSTTSPAPSPHDHDPLHRWYHPCDYCGLWQHTPTAPQHLPAIGSTAFPSRTPLPSVFASRAGVSRHYPHAHSRAPPSPRLI